MADDLPLPIRRQVLLAAGLCLLPLLTQVQPALAVGLAALALVTMAARRRLPSPARFLLLMMLGAIVLVVHDFGIGRDTGSAGLAALLAVKPLETHRLRDAHSLLGFSLFAPFAAFLQDQGPLVLALAVPAVLCVLVALAALAEPPGTAASRGRARAVTVGKALLVALPLAMAAFWLFPRLGTPLWGMPENALGRGGLSDGMRPDQWVDLFANDAPVARITFDDAEPSPAERYWRARVLWDFDGSRWSRGAAPPAQGGAAVEAASPPIAYHVSLEPTDMSYLLSLDLPLQAPPGDQLAADLTISSDQPVSQLRGYRLRSDPLARHGLALSRAERRAALALPPGRNPRTAALAKRWREELGTDDDAFVQRALDWINDDFAYSLTVPPSGRHGSDEFLFDSQVGFCQHFSSAFANLMRAGGIPARVVLGYVGGYRNRYGNYWIVRRMDAHAWTEVWLEGRGWVRVDPTAAVAPERIFDTVEDLARSSALLPEALSPMLDFGDWLRRGWNDFVVAFDARRQASLLRPLGVDQASGLQLGVAFAVGAGLALALTLWLQMRGQPPSRDPLERAWLRFTRRLARAGLAKAPSEPAASFGARAAAALPDQAGTVTDLTGRYVAWRYAGDALDAEAKARLAAELRGWQPARPRR
ncbi:transglutaminase TgpA family protein [Arenimonas composti]|nr:DUF3488 and DUF4129 domain-containing transglutaminase family protein [Arenimonas composti]